MVRVHLKFQHNPLGGVVVFSSKHDCSTSCQCGCSFAGCWDKSFEHMNTWGWKMSQCFLQRRKSRWETAAGRAKRRAFRFEERYAFCLNNLSCRRANTSSTRPSRPLHHSCELADQQDLPVTLYCRSCLGVSLWNLSPSFDANDTHL